MPTHSVPVFEGRQSRRHEDVPLWRLRMAALPFGRATRPESFLQFVGFPRSGHSLIGALIDAHPQAVVSHELDAMGLFRAGFGFRQVARLIERNRAAFVANGQWWNGYSYAVAGAPGKTGRIRVIGDKKGDWAARWSAKTPGLLERVAAGSPARPRWLLVTRDPRDNIATMSLRRGRHYDRLRIEGRSPFGEALAEAQADGRITRTVLDEMIEDYRELCHAIADMKRRIPSGDWFELRYETFVASPEDELRRVLAFLDLPADADYLRACAAVVRPSREASRNRLEWSDAQRAAVADMIREFDFLDYDAD